MQDEIKDKSEVEVNMILMMKQLFDENSHVDTLELRDDEFLKIQHIKEFQPDLLVGTCSEDSRQVLELALETKISYAIFQPQLTEVADLLQQSLADDFQHCGKIIYLKEEDQLYGDVPDHIIYHFKKQGLVMLDGDYLEACRQMAFDCIYWGVQIVH